MWIVIHQGGVIVGKKLEEFIDSNRTDVIYHSDDPESCLHYTNPDIAFFVNSTRKTIIEDFGSGLLQ